MKLFITILLLTSNIFAVTIGGTGQARISCVGGMPEYCARQDTALLNISTPINLNITGAIGIVFSDPDLGSTIERITNVNSAPRSSGCCFTGASGEIAEISTLIPSLFSGDGGYLIWYTDAGTATYILEVDAKTKSVTNLTNITNPHGMNSSGQVTGLAASFWSDTPGSGILYGKSSTTQTQVVAYDAINDVFINSSGSPSNTLTPRVDFVNCPNIPSIIGTGTGFGGVRKDRYVGITLGGLSGQEYYIDAWWDLTANNCYWYDHYSGNYGGTSITSTPTSIGMLPTPLAPTPSVDHTGTSNVCIMITSGAHVVPPGNTGPNPQAIGETLPSPEVCILADLPTATLTLNFNTFSNPWLDEIWDNASGGSNPCSTYNDVTPCAPYSLYIGSTGPGSEVLQTGTTPVSGPSTTFVLSSLVTGTAVPPTQTHAGYNTHQYILSGLGDLAQDTGYGPVNFWTPPNSMVSCPVVTLGSTNASCNTGHRVGGVTHLINASGIPFGSFNAWSNSIRTYATPYVPSTIPSSLIAGGSLPVTKDGEDSHFSWNTLNDLNPVLYVAYCSNVSVSGVCGNGNGSLLPNSNPCTKVNGGFQNEVMAQSTDGTSRYWRFAHHLGTGCQTSWGNVIDFTTGEPVSMQSFDGKLAVLSSPWLWGLGDNIENIQNKSAYPGTVNIGTWQATHAYTSGQIVYDGTNFEKVTVGGTSGGSHPTWPTISGNTVVDGGTLTWEMFTGCNDSNGDNLGLPCRTDLFLVWMK